MWNRSRILSRFQKSFTRFVILWQDVINIHQLNIQNKSWNWKHSKTTLFPKTDFSIVGEKHSKLLSFVVLFALFATNVHQKLTYGCIYHYRGYADNSSYNQIICTSHRQYQTYIFSGICPDFISFYTASARHTHTPALPHDILQSPLYVSLCKSYIFYNQSSDQTETNYSKNVHSF